MRVCTVELISGRFVYEFNSLEGVSWHLYSASKCGAQGGVWVGGVWEVEPGRRGLGGGVWEVGQQSTWFSEHRCHSRTCEERRPLPPPLPALSHRVNLGPGPASVF